MADTIYDEIIAWQKAACCEHFSTKSRRIMIDALLSEILERQAVTRVAAKPSNLSTQIVSKPGPAPAKRFGDGEANGRFAASNLARETKKKAHTKSNISWRERNATQPRRSRLSQVTGAIDVAASSSIKVA